MTDNNKQIRTRFAPSPTGAPHVGNIRTALFAWLFARHNNGQFILRIEDTDQSRKEEGSLEAILKSLDWLGFDVNEGIVGEEPNGEWRLAGDKGPYFQSERLEIYKKYVQELVDKQKAYYCFCSHERLAVLRELQKSKKEPPHYDGHCKSLKKNDISAKLKAKEPYVIRMDIPEEGETFFNDEIKGKVAVQNSTIDHQVLMKSDGFPTYHLASVVDDYLMEISHVIRADEWIPSTPKHVLLYEYFGWDQPKWIHLPIILGNDKSKLSKRHGAVSVLDYKSQGYIPDALMNYLAFLGWNPKTNQEIISREQLIEEFDISKINKNNPIFDITKLNWMNKQYIKTMDPDKLYELIHELDELSDNAVVLFRNKDVFAKTLNLVKDRLERLTDFDDMVSYLWQLKDYDAKSLIAKGLDEPMSKQMLDASFSVVNEIPKENWSEEVLRQTFMDYLKKNDIKTGDMLWPLRVAITGLEKSPDVFGSMDILGREESLERIKKGIGKL